MGPPHDLEPRGFHIAWTGEVPDALWEDGPYRFLRHPLYTSYIAAFAAQLATLPSLWTAAIFLFNAGLYIHSACDDERKPRKEPAGSSVRWIQAAGGHIPAVAAQARAARRRPIDRGYGARSVAKRLRSAKRAAGDSSGFKGAPRAMKIMAGNSNLPLTRAIAGYLEMPLTDASVRRFADEEIFIEIHENVRGEDVFVVQSTSFPTNDNLMELLICIDALRRASARRITAVMPYFGYARQDRKSGSRTPISAKLVANLITEAGANRVLSVDLHAGQIQGFFDIPTDNLYAAPVMSADILARYGGQELTVVSPDVGGVVRARALAKRLDNAPLAIVDKRRDRPGQSEVMNIIGEVEGRACILIDDIIDSGGTLCNAAQALLDAGAKSVVAYITHGVLSGGAVARVDGSALTELVITDTIMPTDAARGSPRIRILPIAPLIGEAVRRIADETSVSSLFD